MVTTHTMLPMTFELFLTKEAVFERRVEMLCLVVGGTMSLRAARRSKKDSSTETSESTEESDAELDVRDDEEEAYGELCSFSSTISTLTMMCGQCEEA